LSDFFFALLAIFFTFGFSFSGLCGVFIAPLSAASKRALASLSGNLSMSLVDPMIAPSEPTDATKAEIGSLCGAWAFLEHVTEQAIWGILKLDRQIGAHVTWRLDMKMRWELLLKVAADHLPGEIAFLRKTNKRVTTCTRDRNIIVHGVIHGLLEGGDPSKPVAFWTVFRGADAGKRFQVSTEAVSIVRENLRILGMEMLVFNHRNRFPAHDSITGGTAEDHWPKRFV
jgi:hypothetical protein